MLPMIALGALAGSSLLSAYGQMKSGEAALDAAKLNADRYRESARRSRMMTAVNIYRQKQYADQVRGSQAATIAKSGGSLDDPTSQEIFKDTTQAASVDEWLIRFAGNIEASNLEGQASNALYEGRMAKGMGQMGATSTLLSGAADLYSGYNSLYPKKVA